MTDCIFCRIAAGTAPARKVCEDDFVLAFLDINPISVGHTLVIPKQHYVNVFDLPGELLAKVMLTAKRLAVHYRTAIGARSVNLLHSAGRAARQDVFHFHLHIIPRHEDDGLHLGYRPRAGNIEDPDKVLARLRQGLALT
jgi:histidine triad (HIT) family protein